MKRVFTVILIGCMMLVPWCAFAQEAASYKDVPSEWPTGVEETYPENTIIGTDQTVFGFDTDSAFSMYEEQKPEDYKSSVPEEMINELVPAENSGMEGWVEHPASRSESGSNLPDTVNGEDASSDQGEGVSDSEEAEEASGDAGEIESNESTVSSSEDQTDSGGEAETEAKYTIMVYMCGSTLEVPLKNKCSASQDIFEMAASGFDPEEVNVLVLAGGAENWYLNDIADAATGIYQIKGNTMIPLLGDGNAYNMGEPDTLTTLLTYGHDYFPAENYGLILWDHGGGALEGICNDVLFDKDKLDMVDLRKALSDSPFGQGKKLDFIGFDACLMATAEVAAVVAPYAGYMIGSEETEPGIGWDYSFLGELSHMDDIEELGRCVIDKYIASVGTASSHGLELALTLSCINLSHLSDVLASVESFFSGLKIEDLETFAAISHVRSRMTSFGRGEYTPEADYDLVDLGNMVDFLSLLGGVPQAQELSEKLAQSVVYSRETGKVCAGLSVYFPFYNKYAMKTWLDQYDVLSVSDAYTRFIRQFGDGIMTNGKCFTDTQPQVWGTLQTAVPEDARDVRSVIVLALTQEQIARFAKAEIIALALGEGENTYHLVAVQDAALTEDGGLVGEYVHTNLFVTGQDGTPLNDAPILYTRRDDGSYILKVILEDAQGQRSDALLICGRDGDEVTVENVCLYDEAIDSYSLRLTDTLENYTRVIYTVTDRQAARNGEGGALLPYEEWEEKGTTEYAWDLNTPWQLSFVEEYLDTGTLRIAFTITDIFNNVYVSEPLPLSGNSDPAMLELTYDDDYVLLDSSTAVLTDLPDQAGYTFSVSLSHQLDGEVFISVDSLVVNGEAIETDRDPIAGSGENGGLVPSEEGILTVLLPVTEEGQSIDAAFDLVLYNNDTEETVSTPVTLRKGL